MLFPKKVKYRKWQTGRVNIKKSSPDTRGTTLSFGSFGLKSEGAGRIKSNQIESARKALSRQMTKTGKLWIRIFPDRPYTAKPAEVGMGKGKGDPQGYCFEIRSGRVIFEVDGVPENVAREALRKAGSKLPVKTKIVSR
ncbi:MAG: 50S ribosomal protein L16 [Candidatus Nomurabacteria bacterium GW2011_GWB1_37_5]|uniref:Large ribosomal subunit protein uL16 n=1 Tax=Candidatus Nomurabacteria bacterium GW2011_GWB1_37_5 TaxID=1618742 RepID=A0A0G0GTE7_9BACT|nr:MAG: 50S ribosomal protein L16 [Candidatus Nomurabacteria bacterium GW2011_GWB1_37_5]